MVNIKKHKNIIIALILVILILISFLLVKRFIKKPLENTSKIDVSEVNTNNFEVVVENQESVKDDKDYSVKNEDQEKFNQAIKNGHIAFGKKNYDQAIFYYQEALTYKLSDEPFSGLFYVYIAKNNINEALVSINKAIELNPIYTDYWISKIALLDQKTNTSYYDLKKIYDEGIKKVDYATRANLATSFALVAESNEQYEDAILSWEKAIEIYPQNKTLYQIEIDRLKN